MRRDRMTIWPAPGDVAGYLFLLLCVFLVFFRGCEAQGQEIVGPDEPLEAGEYAFLEFTGLQDGDAATFLPSKGLDANSKHLRPNHALFWAREPGEYVVNGIVSRVEIDWSNETFINQLIPLQIVVTVEGGDSDPPLPPQPPEPVPGSEWQVLILSETADLLPDVSMGNRRILAGSAFLDRFAQTDHVLQGRWDDDTSSRDGSWVNMAAWKAATSDVQRPLIAIAPKDGGDIRAWPIPADADPDWVFELLQNGGPVE